MCFGCRGEYLDGRNFIARAITAGAAAVLWEQDDFSWNPEWQVPHLAVPVCAGWPGPIAAHVLGDPSRQMPVIGVTSTNGKTSITHWLAQAISALGRQTAVIGTVGNGFWGQLQATTHTRPIRYRCSRIWRRSAPRGAVCGDGSLVAWRGSGRVNGTHFEGGGVHQSHPRSPRLPRRYGKLRRGQGQDCLPGGLKTAVINGDDEFGRKLLTQTRHAETCAAGHMVLQQGRHPLPRAADQSGWHQYAGGHACRRDPHWQPVAGRI